MQTILMFVALAAQIAPPQGEPAGLDPVCKYIIGGLVTALLAVAVWGVKQAREKGMIYEAWIESIREQYQILGLVEAAMRKEPPKGGK